MEFLNSSRSISISRVLVWLFGLCLAALDVGIWPVSRELCRVMPFFSQSDGIFLIVCLYLCNIPGFWLLCCMDRLLLNLRRGEVFEDKNVALLGRISICCFAACLVCLAGCWRIYTLAAVALAAGFMGLIVRIVRDVFAQAVPMRSELDLTV